MNQDDRDQTWTFAIGTARMAEWRDAGITEAGIVRQCARDGLTPSDYLAWNALGVAYGEDWPYFLHDLALVGIRSPTQLESRVTQLGWVDATQFASDFQALVFDDLLEFLGAPCSRHELLLRTGANR